MSEEQVQPKIVPPPAFGWHQGITEEVYNTFDAVRSHELIDILESPAHYMWRKKNPKEPTKAMKFGTLLHAAILEPQKFLKNYRVMPVFSGKTKEGVDSTRSKEAIQKKQAWLDSLEPGNIVLEKEQADKIIFCLNQIAQHPVAGKLFQNGASEVTGIWKDPETGLTCKMRADFIKKPFLIDVKSARSSSPKFFSKQSANLMYHVSKAHYLKGYKAITGEDAQSLHFVIENEGPFECAIYQLDPEKFLGPGEKLRAKAMKILADCKEKNVWPGRSKEVQYLLPLWNLNETDLEDGFVNTDEEE